MKMVFNIYGTWRRVTFEKLMMKTYDFYYSAKSFCHSVLVMGNGHNLRARADMGNAH